MLSRQISAKAIAMYAKDTKMDDVYVSGGGGCACYNVDMHYARVCMLAISVCCSPGTTGSNIIIMVIQVRCRYIEFRVCLYRVQICGWLPHWLFNRVLMTMNVIPLPNKTHMHNIDAPTHRPVPIFMNQYYDSSFSNSCFSRWLFFFFIFLTPR